MKDIMIVAQYTQLPSENNNTRFDYIAKELFLTNKVELVTTNFCHIKKTHRVLSHKDLDSYKVTLVEEPGYKDNISIKRIYSHIILSKNLKKYLSNRKKPDVIYCAVPSLTLANEVRKYATHNKIEFIIDVQDLWPEAFSMVFNVPIISNIVYYPLKYLANKVYKSADQIFAVSNTYLNRALLVNQKAKKYETVFLGTDSKKFDYYANKNVKKIDDKFKIGYIGTLGYSYDIKLVIDSIEYLETKGINNLQFIIMGDGPLRDEFEKYAMMKKINCVFTGRLSYEDMVKELVVCDVAVNPIRVGSAGSIINKVADYAMAGLPVINTQESEEYKDLLEKTQSGFNCRPNDYMELSEKIMLLYFNEELRIQMGINSRKLGLNSFDRERSYIKIFDSLN